MLIFLLVTAAARRLIMDPTQLAHFPDDAPLSEAQDSVLQAALDTDVMLNNLAETAARNRLAAVRKSVCELRIQFTVIVFVLLWMQFECCHQGA